MNCVWTLGAEADVQAIYEGREDFREGAGDAFYNDVLAQVQLLQKHPELGRLVRGTRVTRLLFGRSCYGIFYVRESQRILLYAVLDLRRDPEDISRRIRDL